MCACVVVGGVYMVERRSIKYAYMCVEYIYIYIRMLIMIIYECA